MIKQRYMLLWFALYQVLSAAIRVGLGFGDWSRASNESFDELWGASEFVVFCWWFNGGYDAWAHRRKLRKARANAVL